MIVILVVGFVWVRNPYLFYFGQNIECNQNEVFNNRWGEVACGDVISADNNNDRLYFGRLAQCASGRHGQRGQQHNLFYTAITRAQKLCVLAGNMLAIAIAVRNNKVSQRCTALDWRLANLGRSTKNEGL